MIVLTGLLILAAYLLGSIPSAVWIGKKFYGIDVREYGSKNAGATNTLRVLGRRAALPVFALDVLKGYLAVTLAYLGPFGPDTLQAFHLKIALMGAVVLGHIFPLFAGFKGGKGVATLTGAVLGVFPGAVLLCLAVFLIVFLVSHYVSLSSMTAGVMLPVFVVFVFHDTSVSAIVLSCTITVLLLVTHRKNIRRLLDGTESRIYLRHSRNRP